MIINVIKGQGPRNCQNVSFLAYVRSKHSNVSFLTHSPLGSWEPTTNVIKSLLTTLVSHQLPRSHTSYKYNYIMY